MAKRCNPNETRLKDGRCVPDFPTEHEVFEWFGTGLLTKREFNKLIDRADEKYSGKKGMMASTGPADAYREILQSE